MGDPDLSPEEFWEPILSQPKGTTGERFTGPSIEFLSVDNTIASDLVIGSLTREIRDRAHAILELETAGKDVLAKDGPMQVLRDRLIVGLYEVKKSRYMVSDQLASFRSKRP